MTFPSTSSPITADYGHPSVYHELLQLRSNPMLRSFPQGAIVIFDEDLRYLCAGGLGLADVGLSREMLEGNTISQVFPPEVVTIIEPLYRQALAGLETSMDVPYEGRIYLQRLGPLRDSDGRVVAGMGFTQDVSAARRAERELRESEQRFRLAFDHGPIAMSLVGPDGRYEQVNPAMCRFTGYSAARLEELSDAELTSPEDLDADLAALSTLLGDEQASCTVDKRYLTSTGDIVWGTKSTTLLRGESGAPVQFVVQIQDITARKQKEQQQAEERQRWRDAEAIGHAGSWALDLRTQAVYWSEGLFELYGLDVDNFDGDYAGALNCINAEDRAVIDAGVQACASTGRPLRGRYRIVRATDGAVRWIQTNGEAQYEDGVAVRICGAVVDITEQVAAETDAAAARSFQQAVLTASPDTISVYDLDSRSIEWSNRSISGMLGYSAADMAAMALAGERMVHVEDQPRLDAALAAAHDAVDDAVIDVDYRMATRAGAIRWFSQRTAPLRRDDTGRVTHIVGVLHDSTDERNAQQALLDSEALFRQLADSVDVAFVLRAWDPSSFLYVNPAFKKIFGHDPMTTGEHPEFIHSLVHPDDAEHFSSNYLVPARAGQPAQVEYRIIRPDSEVRWLRSKVAPVPDIWGNQRRSASTTEDITANRRAQAALIAASAAERANTAKNEFLSRMSHELRTPLNAVLGFAQLLELDHLGADQVNAVHHILRGGRHLLGLIDDVLDISKIEGDRLETSLELVPVSRLISETVELMSPLASAANVVLHHDVAVAANRPVRADHRRLRQVVLNLISNAIKYNRPGGRVDISCALTTPTHLDIVVRDNGRGIRAEHLPRLFVPFDRLDYASSDIEGTGVGLALSYRLMAHMDGSLTASSEFGVGSVFTASIPLATGSDVAAPSSSAPTLHDDSRDRSDRPARTMLYIEDNSSNIDLMEQLVGRRAEWTMVVAGHGALGLELAASNAPDLVLLDLHLPDMDGIDVLHRLQADARTHHLAVVVISADASPNQIDRLLASGAQAYLTKPLMIAELLALLDSVGSARPSSS